MNVIKLLRNDHRRALSLIEQIENDSDEAASRSRAKLFDELKDSLSLHATVEERIFYPALEKFDETRGLVDEFYREHQEADRILAKMESRKNGSLSGEWQNQLQELKRSIEHHINEEENRLFPQAEKLLGKERLSEMFFESERIKNDQSETDSLIYPADRFGVKH
jgi:hemerythrin-like domain-containing protein